MKNADDKGMLKNEDDKWKKKKKNIYIYIIRNENKKERI